MGAFIFGIIYLITNLLDGKQCVGQTTHTLEERFYEHVEADSLLDKAIRKYGAENFSREVLTEYETQEQLDVQRIFLEDDWRENYVLSDVEGHVAKRTAKTDKCMWWKPLSKD